MYLENSCNAQTELVLNILQKELCFFPWAIEMKIFLLTGQAFTKFVNDLLKGHIGGIYLQMRRGKGSLLCLNTGAKKMTVKGTRGWLNTDSS